MEQWVLPDPLAPLTMMALGKHYQMNWVTIFLIIFNQKTEVLVCTVLYAFSYLRVSRLPLQSDDL